MSLKIAAKIAGTEGDPCCCNPCSLNFRYIQGTAQKCGFPAFGEEDPDQFFRRKIKTGTIHLGTWSQAECPQLAGASAPPLDIGSAAWDHISDGPYDYGVANFTVAKDGSGYRITFLGGTWHKADGQSGSFICMRIWNGPGAADSGAINPGATSAILPAGTYLNLSLDFYLFGDRQFSVGNLHEGAPANLLPDPFELGALPDLSIRDIWDRRQEYLQKPDGDKPTYCELTETLENSARFSQAHGPFPLNSGGANVGLPIEADYAGLSNESLEVTLREVTGTDICTPAGTGIWAQLQGSFSEQLLDEDKLDDAIQRAINAAGGWTACNWTLCSAYGKRTSGSTYVFRRMEVQVAFQAIIGASYEITLFLAQRPFGTGGPFVPQGILQSTVQADQVSELGPWLDIPITEGMETEVLRCRIELVS